MPQLVGSDAAVLDLPAGLPLGVGLSHALGGYVEATMAWQPGDRLLMYTDGLSEARDVDGEFLPVPTLATPVRSGSVEQAIAEVVTAVTTHVPRGRLDDDLAVILIEHLPGPAPEHLPARNDERHEVSGGARTERPVSRDPSVRGRPTSAAPFAERGLGLPALTTGSSPGPQHTSHCSTPCRGPRCATGRPRRRTT